MVVERKFTSPGVRQCLKILAWTARNPSGIGFNDLREKVFHIPASTLTRHLKVLMEENWLKRGEDGLYRPGPAYLCSVTNMTGKPNPEGLIRPVVERLALETGHSAAFAEWDRGGIRFSLRKDMPRSFCHPGERELIKDIFSHPFALTALAFLPPPVVEWNRDSRPEELNRTFGGLEEGKAGLESILRTIRGEEVYRAFHLCRRVCAPVRYRNGDLAGVIGLSLLGDESETDVMMVREAVREIEGMEL